MDTDPASGSNLPSTAPQALRILVLDDELHVLKALDRSLTSEGFAVLTATRTEAALLLLDARAPDAVVSDYRMPHENGLTFLEEVRRRRPEVRRVLLTGQADIHALCDAINRGSLHRLFLKPWSHEDLVAALREECQQGRLAAEAEDLRRLADRRAHELELAQRLLRVQRLAAVGQLAAGIAHEINNPLGSILAFAQILLRDGKLSLEDREAVGFIEEGALRCKRVIDAVVKFAIRGNALPAEVRPAELVREIASLLEPELRRANAEVEIAIADPELIAWGSQQEIGQAISALVRNAIEALGGPRRRIDLSLTRNDGWLRLAVSDTGRGVPPELRERIFQPFFTTKGEGEAAGLGLTIADRIAQSHGGHIEVQSEAGVGSTFTLVLPRYVEEDGSAGRRAEAAGPEHSKGEDGSAGRRAEAAGPEHSKDEAPVPQADDAERPAGASR